jgi:hypothetical protein
MTQSQLHRAIARATGESVRTIRHLGFGFLTDDCEGRDPLVIDWDQHDAMTRYSVFPQRTRQTVLA